MPKGFVPRNLWAGDFVTNSSKLRVKLLQFTGHDSKSFKVHGGEADHSRGGYSI